MTIQANNLKNWWEQPGSDLDNKAHLEGTSIYNGVEYTAAQIDAVLSGSGSGTVILNQVVTRYTDSGLIIPAGKAAFHITATQLDMTLAPPIPNCFCEMNIVVKTAPANVVVTCAPGVTFDGTNNTATFDANDSYLAIGYKSVTEWEIFDRYNVHLTLV